MCRYPFRQDDIICECLPKQLHCWENDCFMIWHPNSMPKWGFLQQVQATGEANFPVYKWNSVKVQSGRFIYFFGGNFLCVPSKSLAQSPAMPNLHRLILFSVQNRTWHTLPQPITCTLPNFKCSLCLIELFQGRAWMAKDKIWNESCWKEYFPLLN